MSWFRFRPPQDVRDQIVGEHGRARLTLPEDGQIIYAIGDVHGRLDLLLKLEDVIVRDAATIEPGRPAIIVLLGDMIDRGPRSADVLDHLRGPAPPGFERLLLAGNHEMAMLRFLDGEKYGADWLEFGGLETLRSYRVPALRYVGTRRELRHLRLAALASIPDEHVALLRGLPIALRWGRYLMVHAGILPGVSLARQTESDLTEIRDAFTRSTLDHGFVVVHGHTPTVAPERQPNRINIDLGAYATGRLAAVRLIGDATEFLYSS